MRHGAVGTAGAGTTNSQMIGAEHQQESDQNFHKSSRVSAAGLRMAQGQFIQEVCSNCLKGKDIIDFLRVFE